VLKFKRKFWRLKVKLLRLQKTVPSMSGMRGILSRNSRDRVFVHAMTEIQLISLDVVLYEMTVKYAQNSLNQGYCTQHFGLVAIGPLSSSARRHQVFQINSKTIKLYEKF
jgi:hypothetical protein